MAPTEQSAEYIKEQAKAMKLNIPEPISWNRLTEIGGGGYGGGPYLLDELGGVLGWLNIKTATYQFIRFNCAHMAWLWQNGNLLQVYC